MKDVELQQNITRLISNRNLEEAERLLLDYLKVNSFDIDGWSRLVILETLSPIEDYERATEYLHTALEYDKDNLIFFVLILFFTEWYLGGLKYNQVEKAFEIKETADGETSSMISFILAWHLKSRDISKFKSLLIESINECPTHVINYTDLGKYYLSKGEKELGTTMIRRGIENVITLYKDSKSDYDPLDITHFVNERITGVFMTEDTYNSLKKLVVT